MFISESEFQILITNIPAIQIELNWNGEEGSAQLEDQEFYCDMFLVLFSGTVSAIASSDNGDQTTSPSFTIESYNLDLTDLTAFIEDVGEVISFSEDQELRLVKAISDSFIE